MTADMLLAALIVAWMATTIALLYGLWRMHRRLDA